jgi:hypothetical protein
MVTLGAEKCDFYGKVQTDIDQMVTLGAEKCDFYGKEQTD